MENLVSAKPGRETERHAGGCHVLRAHGAQAAAPTLAGTREMQAAKGGGAVGRPQGRTDGQVSEGARAPDSGHWPRGRRAPCPQRQGRHPSPLEVPVLNPGCPWIRQGSCEESQRPGLGPRGSRGAGQGRQGAELAPFRGILGHRAEGHRSVGRVEPVTGSVHLTLASPRPVHVTDPVSVRQEAASQAQGAARRAGKYCPCDPEDRGPLCPRDTRVQHAHRAALTVWGAGLSAGF